MMGIAVDVDISGALRKIAVARDQVPFATSLALNRTAYAVKADEQDEMRAVFKNPRKYTLNSLSIERSTKSNLTARLFVRSRSVEAALRPEIYGGQRDRAIEKVLGAILPSGLYAVPAVDARRGQDGKVSINWVRGLVAKLGYTSNVSGAATRRRRTASSTAYFLLQERHGRLLPGIYQRNGRNVVPLILFTRRPSYTARFDFYGVAKRSVAKHFEPEFRKAVEQALRTAR